MNQNNHNHSVRFDFPRSFDLAEFSEPAIETDEVQMMTRIIDDLYLKNRSLVTEDYDQSLSYLSDFLPFDTLRFPTGYEAFTWTVPERWTVRNASITYQGESICDFKDHPLHLMSYSSSFAGRLNKKDLLPHLYTNPDRPDAIPYQYSYHVRDWGMCIPYSQYKSLPEGNYDVHIDTAFETGELKVGEYILPGNSTKSIVFSAHLDHPAQVNDGLGGVALGIALFKRLAELPTRRYTYRLVILPENIGSACYLHHYRKSLDIFEYGVFLEMVVSKGRLCLQQSRQGNSPIDRLAEVAIKGQEPAYGVGPFRQVICNDEINFNGPQIDIPTITLTRWPYPEYHTSDDGPGIVSTAYLNRTLQICWDLVSLLESNVIPQPTYQGNIRLSKYDLFENLNLDDTVERFMLAVDGERTILDIADYLNIPFKRVEQYVKKFEAKELIKFR